MPLFLFIFHIFFYNMHTYIHTNHIHIIHISVAICWGLSPFPHRMYARWETPPYGAELGIELGPALQQADALPTEPRRTITEPRRTILSHAALIQIQYTHTFTLMLLQPSTGFELGTPASLSSPITTTLHYLYLYSYMFSQWCGAIFFPFFYLTANSPVHFFKTPHPSLPPNAVKHRKGTLTKLFELFLFILLWEHL